MHETICLDYRDLSWNILIAQRITVLPVSLSAICDGLSVQIHSYNQARKLLQLLHLEPVAHRSDGFSFTWEQERWILFNADMPITRRRFTAAHELGHLLMHQNKECISQGDISASLAEWQANRFAADLLAPACVLWGMGVTNASEIASICAISCKAAQLRMKRLEQLRKRDQFRRQETGKGVFLLSPLERRVYEQFQDFIEANRINP